jgi:hypothetical protein
MNGDRKASLEEIRALPRKVPALYIVLPADQLQSCGKWFRLLATALDPKGELRKVSEQRKEHNESQRNERQRKTRRA